VQCLAFQIDFVFFRQHTLDQVGPLQKVLPLVQPVGDDGVSQMVHVNPQLVRPAGLWTESHPGEPAIPFQNFVISRRMAAVATRRTDHHPFAVPQADLILRRCFEGDQSYCDQVERNSDGQIVFLTVMPVNADYHTTSGFDVEASYTFALADMVSSWDGDFALRALVSFVDTNEFVQNDSVVEIAGQNAGGTSGNGIPETQWQVRLTYSNDPITFNLTGRGLSSGVIDNRWIACTSNCPPSSAINRTVDKNRVAGASYLDASFGYQFREGVEAYVRVDNVLDKDPPLAANDYFLSLGVNAESYDVLGRMYRAGVRFGF